MRYIDQFTNYLDRLDPYFAAFEAYLADSFAKFDPVNVFYGVLIAMIVGGGFLAPWLAY